MDAPPVQYVKTRDGFNIAFAASGAGEPFVIVPFIFNNLSGLWRLEAFRSLFEPLASRFALVQYDARGMGDSQRGLPDDFEFQDCVADLEAVADHLRLERMVVFAFTHGCHTAIRYAALHPERVRALILANPIDVSTAWGYNPLFDMARIDWDGFLTVWVEWTGRSDFLEATRRAWNQDDFLKALDVSPRSAIGPMLPSLTMPTLVVSGTAPPTEDMAEAARAVAQTAPNARLVKLDGVMGRDYLYGSEAKEPTIIAAIDDFVSGLPDDADTMPGSAPAAGLSSRELEVLRLLAAGRSNPDIAKELFITRNTVQNHVSSILIKLNLQNRAQAAVYAKEHSIV